MTYLAWAFVLAMIGMALIDPVSDIVRHLSWRRRWKRDDMGYDASGAGSPGSTSAPVSASPYRRYLTELERLQAEPPKVCRTKRQRAGKSDG